MELELAEKSCPVQLRKLAMIEAKHPTLNIRRQRELIGLNRATYY